LRQLLTDAADAFSDIERALWYDVITQLREVNAAAQWRRASATKGERSNLEGERSNFEGERRKRGRFVDRSAVSPAKS